MTAYFAAGNFGARRHRRDPRAREGKSEAQGKDFSVGGSTGVGEVGVRQAGVQKTEPVHGGVRGVRAGFVVFKPYPKSIREKDGEVDLRTLVEKSRIRRFLFGGIKKSVFNRTGFDSDPERRFAVALEDDDDVLKWVRPPQGQTPISYKGATYNVDFIVETGTERFLIEVKARDELGDAEVTGKAQAAVKWCDAANQKQGGKRWAYAVIPDDAVSETSSLAHLLAQAVKALSSDTS